MKLEEIKDNVYPEDKAMAAVFAECSYRFVDQVLSGARNTNIKKGKKVIEKLEQLAKVNIDAMNKKSKLIAA